MTVIDRLPGLPARKTHAFSCVPVVNPNFRRLRRLNSSYRQIIRPRSRRRSSVDPSLPAAVTKAGSARPAASSAGVSGSVDMNGVGLDASKPAAEPIDVNGLPCAALLQALIVNDNLKGMHETVKRRIAAERQVRPFDSVADLQRRVNASATKLNDRLGKAYLPYLRISAPVCLPRVSFSPTGSLLGGVPASTAPDIARATSRSAGGVHVSTSSVPSAQNGLST